MSSNKSEFIAYRRLAVAFIIIGLLLAVDTIIPTVPLYKLWPLSIGIIGGGFIGIFYQRQRGEAIFLAIGTYLLQFMFLAFYCNFWGWESLAVWWPLFIGFIGIDFLTLFIWYKRRQRFLLFGFILLSLMIVFLLVFTINPHFWWMIFILIGLSILWSEKAQ